MKNLVFDKNGYLQPGEPIEVDLETLEKYFVKDFSNSQTRRKLFDNYLRFLYQMQDEVFPIFEQWINGSFVTQKENPKDIDVVTFIDYRVWNSRSEKKMNEFWTFSLEEQGIDSYLVKEYPKEHPKFDKYISEQNIWQSLYNADRDNRQKGFLKLIFQK